MRRAGEGARATRLRTSERQRIHETDWGFASVASALVSHGIPLQRAARALGLLRRREIPADRLGSALVLVFGLAELCPPGGGTPGAGT